MYYAIISEDVADSLEKRKGARPGHIARCRPYAIRAAC